MKKSHKGIILIAIAILLLFIGLSPIAIVLFPISFIFLVFDIKQNYYSNEKATSSEENFRRWKAKRESKGEKHE